MQANKKIMLFLIVMVLIFLSAGCPSPQELAEVIVKPAPAQTPSPPLNMSRRFAESTPKGQTVVESAIELSKKYAKLSEEMAAQRQKNLELTAENRRLRERLKPCQDQLKQTQEELTAANDLLIEMRIELNNWKTDILGFRNEMRDAEKAQLEALLKILKILGGEVKAESTKAEPAASAAVSTSEPNQPDR